MLFNYLDIETETYDNARWYQTPAGAYPSITSILGHTASQEKIDSLNRWRDSRGHKEADEYTQQRADHGTMVHLLIERFLKGEDAYAPVPGKIISGADIAAFKSLKFKLKNITSVWGQEVALFSTNLEIAGRCDLICEYNGVPAIVDFKTSARIKNDADIHDYKLQLCFYAQAHNEMFNTNITEGVVLMATNSIPQEFKIYLPDFESALQIRAKTFWKNTINKINNN